ncbi:hypothetical protein JW948_14010 [bacterium]|nr:hypothetical protein [bacterium]
MRSILTGFAITVLLFTVTAYAQKMTVKDSESHVLMEVNDEGDAGSVTLPSAGMPASVTNKLYNNGGTLYWNGTALGTSGSAGGWSDDGAMVRLVTDTDKVGIGDATPTCKLDVAGKIGITDTQVVYLPGQTQFSGSLFLGNGGNCLSHISGNDGRYNTGAGINALLSNTTGTSNSANGYGALNNNTTGEYNTAVGSTTMRSNTTGSSNTAVGRSALFYNSTGQYNIGIGASANGYNEEGSGNVMIGYMAGFGSFPLHNKSGNVMIGHLAGYNAGSDNNFNVFIGYGAGYWAAGSNRLYIENSASETPLIGGDFTADEVYLNGQVGIGVMDPDNETELHIRSATDHNFGVLTEAMGITGTEIGLHTGSAGYSSLAKNAYFDAGSWHRYDTGSGAFIQEIEPDGKTRLKTAPSGSNPIVWREALVLGTDGRVGANTVSPTATLDLNGPAGYDQLRLRTSYTPKGTADTNGHTGDIAWDDSYIYVKTTAGWKRSALSTF